MPSKQESQPPGKNFERTVAHTDEGRKKRIYGGIICSGEVWVRGEGEGGGRKGGAHTSVQHGLGNM